MSNSDPVAYVFSSLTSQARMRPISTGSAMRPHRPGIDVLQLRVVADDGSALAEIGPVVSR